jgi:type VI secretion system protein ImpH
MREPPDPVTLARRRAALLADMAAQPWRYDFFHALRLIEAHSPDKPRLGLARRPADEPLRLGQSVELSFAPAAIDKVVASDRDGRPRMEVRFFGLFGPNGPLPLHMTAYARERKLHKGDHTLSRFADWFHHRLLLLFYRAWAQAQPAASLDRPAEDRFAAYVGSLIGVGGPEYQQRSAAPDHARLAFAGLLSRQVRSAEGLETLLAGFLGMKVKVEQFVGRWMHLPGAERSRLGGGFGGRPSSAQLGVSTVLGREVYDRQHHFRIHLGPLTVQAFEALLPDGRALPAINALVRDYIGLEFGWDLCLQVRTPETPTVNLGRHGRLGWTSWIGKPRPAALSTLTLEPRHLTG